MTNPLTSNAPWLSPDQNAQAQQGTQQQDDSGGFPMFPQGQQQAPWNLPWTYGQVAQTAQNFGPMLQQAMGQIGGQLNANADRISAARPIQAMYDIDSRRTEYDHEAQMAQIANQGRFMDMMGRGFGGMGQGPMGSINVTGGPSMADQGAAAGARDNLYGGLMGDLSGAAFTGTGIPGFQTPGGEVSAQVPTPPWAGGQPGSVQAGIDTTPGRVWNEDYANQARDRLGSFADRTLPFLDAAPGSGREGLAQNFQDLVGGLNSRSLNDLSRAGTRAEGGHQLASQTAASQGRNALWNLMAQIYGSQLGGKQQENMLTLAKIRALHPTMVG
jgi:hypothetical protein